MTETILELPLLSLLLATLPVSAVLTWLMPNARQARWIALFTAAVDLILSLLIVFAFDKVTIGMFICSANIRSFIVNLAVIVLFGQMFAFVFNIYIPFTILNKHSDIFMA